MSKIWPEVPLMEVCRPKQWPTIPQTSFLPEGYPVYGANGKIGFYSTYNHENPTVLITCRGATCGTINVCEPQSYVTGNAMALDSLDQSRVDLRYLVHALRNGTLSKAISGTAQPQITREGLTAVLIPLPPIAEQRRIAEILDRVEALRAKRRAVLSQLDTLTQSIFFHLFGEPSANVHGFPMRRIGEVVSRLTNGFVGPTRGIYQGSGVPYLLAKHVKANQLNFDGKTFVSEAFNQKNAKSILRTGDVLLVQSGHIGESAVVPPRHEGHNCHAMIVLTPRKEVVLGEYLSCLFSTASMQRSFGGIQTGITLAHLNCRDVRELMIPLPTLELQLQLIRRLQAVKKLRTALRASSEKMDAFFATVRHRAFRGEL